MKPEEKPEAARQCEACGRAFFVKEGQRGLTTRVCEGCATVHDQPTKQYSALQAPDVRRWIVLTAVAALVFGFVLGWVLS
jgi:hypothetical protein